MTTETNVASASPALAELARALREAADTLERLHIDVADNMITGTIGLHGLGKTDLATFARQLGHVSKHVGGSGETFWLDRRFGRIVLSAFARSRDEVCRRVVVGTEEVPEQVIPAHTREIVEWDCGSLLADTPREEATV